MHEAQRGRLAGQDQPQAATGARLQLELVVEMRDRSLPWAITLWPSHSSLMRSAADHRVIVAALKSRDQKAVAEAVRRHIHGSEPHYAHYANKGSSGQGSPAVIQTDPADAAEQDL